MNVSDACAGRMFLLARLHPLAVRIYNAWYETTLGLAVFKKNALTPEVLGVLEHWKAKA